MSSASGKILARMVTCSTKQNYCKAKNLHTSSTCDKIFTGTDALMPQPSKTRITTFVGATVAVSLGVSMGAHMSKNIASFLEENDLFIPSDDDDDD